MMNKNQIKAYYNEFIDQTTGAYNIGGLLEALFGENGAQIFDNNPDANSIVMQVNSAYNGEDMLDWLVKGIIALTTYVTGTTDKSKMTINDTKTELSKRLMVRQADTLYKGDNYSANQPILDLFNIGYTPYQGSRMTWPYGFRQSENYPAMLLSIPQETQYEEGGTEITVGRKQVLFSLRPYLRVWIRQWTGDTRGNWSLLTTDEHMLDAISQQLTPVGENVETLKDLVYTFFQGGNLLWKFCTPYNGNFGGLEIRLKDRNIVHIDGDKSGSGGLSVLLYEDDLPGWLVPETEYVATAMLSYGDATGIKLEIEFREDDTFINRKIALVGQNGNFTVPANANKIKVAISVTGELGAHVHCGIIFGLFASPHFAGDVYAGGEKLATEDYVNGLTNDLDERTDELEEKTTTLESQTAALETKTSILKNADGDAKFTGDVFAKGRKLATEKYAEEANARYVGLLTGDDLIAKYCSHEKREINGVTFQWTSGTTLDLHRASGTAAAEYTLYTGELPWWLAAGKKYDVKCSVERHGGTSVPLELSFSFRSGDRITVVNFANVGGTMTVPSDADSVEITVDVAAGRPEDIHATLTLGLFPDVVFNGDLTVGGTIIADGSRLASQEYADEKAADAENNAKAYADGILAPVDARVTAIKNKTDLFTKDGNAAKFTGDVYANNKKLATEESVTAVSGEVDALDGRTDTLETTTTTLGNRATSLESRATALETTTTTLANKTSILKNDDGAAKFTGDVYANGEKLATEESVGELTADKLAIVVAEELPTGEDIKEKTIYCIPDNKGGHDKWLYVPDANKTEADCWEQFGGGFGGAMVIIDAEDGATAGVRPAVGAEGVDYYIQNGDSYTHQVYRVIDGTGAWYYIGQDQTLANRVRDVENNIGTNDSRITSVANRVTKLEDHDAGRAVTLAYEDSNLWLVDENGEQLGESVTITGGGGGGTSVAYAVKIVSNPDSLGTTFDVTPATKDADSKVSFCWYATQNGAAYTPANATLRIEVNGTVVKTINNASPVEDPESIQEPDFITENVASYLRNGENTVRVRISFTSEEERTIQQQKTWYINLYKTDLSWSLAGRDIAYYDAQRLSMTFFVESIAHTTLHYQFVNSQEEIVSSATVNDADGTIARTIDIPEGETTLFAWLSYTLRGTTYETTKISAVMVRGVAETTLSVLDTSIEADQYDTLAIRWMASGPDTSYSVEKRVNGTLISTESVERTMQIWRYKCRETGTFTLTLKCGSVAKNITVVVNAVEGLAPVTSGLIMDVDPAGHSNSEANKDNFGYIDGNGNNHPFTFSPNFDWVNGGFQTDPATGATVFVIRRGTWINFDRGLFRRDDNTATAGKCILMQFQVKDCVDYDAKVGSSYYANDRLGLRLNAHDAVFEGGGRNVKVNYCEESLIELGLNIDVTKTRKLANDAFSGIYKFWLGGTPANSAPFTVGESFAPASDTNPFKIGSDDCDIWLYRFKMYNQGLSDGEMLRNFIVDCPDKEELSERYNRNKIFVNDNALEGTISVEKLTAACPELFIIEISASEFPQGKGSKNAKPCSIVCTKGGVKQFEAPNAKYTLQGTSSMNYIAAAGNLDIDISADWPSGYAMTSNSIKVSYFNLKANVASSENANNVCAADLFNTYYPIKSLAQKKDSRVRNTVEGHPCAVFIHNSGSGNLILGSATDDSGTTHNGRVLEADKTILYFAGDMNNSKNNTAVFGQSDKEDDDENQLFCVEFLSNGQTRSRFKASDFDNECWNKEKEPIAPKGNHFEFRYVPDGKEKAAKEKFKKMQQWVWMTDCYPDPNTGYQFSRDDLPDGTPVEEHRAYRREKFKNELSQYFDIDGLAFYYVFTEFFLAMDQREKNQFCSYEPDKNGDWKFNFSKFYDADTILGIDNLGNMSLTYGLEDHPTTENTGKLSDDWVYDTGKGYDQEPVLWANLRECFPGKIKEWYQALDGTLFSASKLITKFRNYQKIRPEALMIESYNGVYDDPYIRAGETTYLESMFYGQKAEQREQFLKYQQIYMSSKYSSNTATNNALQIRSNPRQDAADFRKELTFIPYSDMYCCVGKDSNNIWDKQRVSKGESVTLTDLADVDNTVRDNVFVNVYSINNIKHVSTAAYLYPARYTVGNAAKLQDMLLGAGDNYANTNALSVSPETVPLAEEIDLRGQFLVGNTVALDLSNNKWLKRLYLQNSGVTGVTFADGCPLTETRLGKNVQRIRAKNLNHVTAFTFENNDYSALRSLLVENSVGFPLKAILDNAFSLTNIRLTGVDLQWADASTLMRIAMDDNVHGITADGVDDGTSAPIIKGTVTFDNISDADKATLQEKFGNGLTINGGGGSALHLVTFYNGEKVFAKEYVLHGGNATDPRNAGYGTPTKAADAHYTYAFSGWRGNLTNITKDVDIYAEYAETVRTYRVTFFNGDEEIYHVDAQYGAEVQYSDATAVAAGKPPYPLKDTKLCVGFSADGGSTITDTFTVHGNIDAKAQFETVAVPTNPKSLNECSWAEIKAIVENGSLADNGKWVANGIEWFATTYPSAATTGNAKAVTINYTVYEDRAGTTGKKWSPYRDYYRGNDDYIVTDKSDTILFFPCATNHDYKVTGEIVNGDDASVLTDWHRFTTSTDQNTIDTAILAYRRQARRTNSVTFLASQTLDFKTIFQANTSNRVSWPNSLVRKILTGSGGNTTSVEYEQIVWNCLPFDLRAAITPVLKFSNSGPNTTTSSTDLHVDYVSIDRLFLPARGELISPIMNETTKENWYKETYEGENDKGLYDCFTVEGNRAVKDTNNVPVTYWLRTRGVNNSVANAVADVEAISGKVYSTNGVSINASFSVLFGFCI